MFKGGKKEKKIMSHIRNESSVLYPIYVNFVLNCIVCGTAKKVVSRGGKKFMSHIRNESSVLYSISVNLVLN